MRQTWKFHLIIYMVLKTSNLYAQSYHIPDIHQVDSIYKASIDTAGYIESMMKDWHYSIEEFRKWGLYDFNPADSKHMMLRVRLIKEADGSLRFIPEGIPAQFDIVYVGKEGWPRFLMGRHDQRILEPDGSVHIEKLIEVEHQPWSFNNKSFRNVIEQNPDIILSCFVDLGSRCLFFIKDGQLFFQWDKGYKSFAGKAYRWDEAMKKYEIREFLKNLSEYFSRKNLPPDVSVLQIPVLCI